MTVVVLLRKIADARQLPRRTRGRLLADIADAIEALPAEDQGAAMVAWDEAADEHEAEILTGRCR